MADLIIWFALAGVLAVAELFVGVFYLLMISLGLVAGGIAALSAATMSRSYL